MRLSLGLALLFAFPLLAVGQEKEPPRRYGVRLNLELYPQKTPKDTMATMVKIMYIDRFDYLIAHLIEPAYIDEQLKITYPTFEKQARAQVQREGLDKRGVDPGFIRARIADQAASTNFEYLALRVKSKLETDPESLKELKQMAREGEVQEMGETAVARLKDVKDRALYFRKVGDRWFLENKMQEEKPAE